MRATRPRLRLSGRPRQGRRPSVEVAKSFAPVTRSGPLSGRQVAEDIAPGAVAQDRGAQTPLAVAEAFYLPDAMLVSLAASRVARQGVRRRAGGRRSRSRRGRTSRRRPSMPAWPSMPAAPVAEKCRRPSSIMLLARDTRQAVGYFSDGRSPGSRVVALAAFPGTSQWFSASARRLQLRGQLRSWPKSRTAFPLSLPRCGRRTVGREFRRPGSVLSTRRYDMKMSASAGPRSPAGTISMRSSPSQTCISRNSSASSAAVSAARRARHRRQARAERRPGGPPSGRRGRRSCRRAGRAGRSSRTGAFRRACRSRCGSGNRTAAQCANARRPADRTAQAARGHRPCGGCAPRMEISLLLPAFDADRQQFAGFDQFLDAALHVGGRSRK